MTNVPSQALYLLNSPFIATAAQKLGARVVAAYPAGPNGGRSAELALQFAYWLVLSRAPSAAEREAAFEFFANFPSASAAGEVRTISTAPNDPTAEAWTSFCRVLFASAEFRFLK